MSEAISEAGSVDLDYNVVQNLPYLDKFMHEVLRYYPLTPIERRYVHCTDTQNNRPCRYSAKVMMALPEFHWLQYVVMECFCSCRMWMN